MANDYSNIFCSVVNDEPGRALFPRVKGIKARIERDKTLQQQLSAKLQKNR